MITIDFETRSEVDIIVAGGHNYHVHPSTDILVMGYKVDDGPVQFWYPGNPFPSCFLDTRHTIYAFNFAFELGIWNNVGVKKYGWPELRAADMQDVQALCARYGLPQNLREAAKVLNVPTQKDEFGKRLIKLFCTPPFGRDSKGNLLPQLQDQWRLFLQYNKHDVEATYQVLKALPADRLSEVENKIWLLNHKINVRGIPVAVDEARQILRVTNAFLDEHNQRLPMLTDGKVSKITQVKRIKDWMTSRGYECESLSADELQKWLQRDDLPDDITEVLEIRAGMGLSSLGKYKRILNEEHNGRMYYNSRYYGAHTGRITGMGLQLLNLPRASVDSPDAEIEKFFDLSILFANPVLSARALVRPMVKASPGKVIIAADYSSIEYILLMYMCEDDAAVKRFASGIDQYKDLASHMYGVPYEKVTKEQRQMGKMGILGCGYGLGAEGFIGYADKWGVKLDRKTANETVSGFRSLYNNTPKFWYAANECAINAVEFPGRTFSTNRTEFKVVYDRNKRKWLATRLPSGRTMYYFNPNVEDGKFGPNVTSWSVNQTTKTWCKKYMSPGKWVENIIQALGRDLLYYGKFALESAGFPIIFSVYDEVVAEVDEDKADLPLFENLMSSVPPWAKGLPLRAEGYVSNRYKKG